MKVGKIKIDTDHFRSMSHEHRDVWNLSELENVFNFKT